MGLSRVPRLSCVTTQRRKKLGGIPSSRDLSSLKDALETSPQAQVLTHIPGELGCSQLGPE